MFDLIHIVTTDHSSITRITKEVSYCLRAHCLPSVLYYSIFIFFFIYASNLYKQVVEDFASENVVYLELRTTPKVTCGARLVILFVLVSMDWMRKAFS